MIAPSGASAVSPLHSISVYGENEGGPPLAVFTTAKCTRKTDKFGKLFRAEAISTDGKSKLELDIGEFAGFKKEYEMEFGAPFPKPFVTVRIGEGKGSDFFTSYYEPPAPVPAIGRALFREGGRLLGIGFGPAMFNYHGTHAITFTGVVECEKPKKGKKGKA